MSSTPHGHVDHAGRNHVGRSHVGRNHVDRFMRCMGMSVTFPSVIRASLSVPDRTPARETNYHVVVYGCHNVIRTVQ